MSRIAVSGLFAVFVSTATLHAATYWVSADGKASWRGAQSESPLMGADACSLDTANSSAQAGDSVFLRGGRYTGQTIRPRNSGTSEKQRIVFSGHENETVVLDRSNGIHLEQQSYITISDIEFRDTLMFFRIIGGHHNTIHDCLFDGRSVESQAWAGAAIVADRRRNPSTHNWIHHCRFYRFVYKAERPNRGALMDVGNLNAPADVSGCTHNRIEHNIFAYGGHHTLGVYSKYNVIRFNYIHNETNPENWDFPGYRGAVTQGTSGGYCLYEGNRFGFSGQAGIGLRSPRNILRRNVFYHNAQGGIQVVTNAVGKDKADENYIYLNTFFHNGYGSQYPGFQGGMYFASWSGVSPNGNVVRCNLFSDNKNGPVSYDRPADPQTIDSNWSEKSLPQFVDVESTDPNAADLPDLRLRFTSPAIDQGGWLTTITSENGRGNTFQVADSRYFIDGWGIIPGDQIQLQQQNSPVTINAVDSSTHRINVDRELDFVKGQGVALAYQGKRPEPGAYEIVSPIR